MNLAYLKYWGEVAEKEAPEEAQAAHPVFEARPDRGEINFDALRASVMARLTKARAYLAR